MAKVYTGGSYDLFHAGHAHFLRICKDIAGYPSNVTVGLNSNEFISRFKGRPPVCSYDERAAVLRSCRYVDTVVENIGDEDSTLAIQEVNPDFVVIGSDWAVKDYYKQMGFTAEWLSARSITVLYVDRGPIDLSTTAIRERIR